MDLRTIHNTPQQKLLPSTTMLATNQQPISKKQLITILEKRIRKQLRMDNLIEKGTVIYVTDELTKFFLETVITLPIIIKTIAKAKLAIKVYDYSLFSNKSVIYFCNRLQQHEKLFLPLLMDDYNAFFCTTLFENKKISEIKNNKMRSSAKAFHSLFETIAREEFQQLADTLKLKVNLKRHHQLYKFLDAMEQKFPGTKHSLYKSYLYYRKILQK